MAFMLWFRIVVVVLALSLLIAWVVTGRRHQIFLRLFGVCGVIMGLLLLLQAGR